MVMEAPAVPVSETIQRLSPFKHGPLDPSKHEMRLVRLLPAVPGSRTAHIHCSISRHEAAFAPHYIAVSYTWQPVRPMHEIIINHGSTLNIGKNLFDFLTVMNERRRGGDMDIEGAYFWIDQISIDQTNVLEKNHQVQYMADIYRGARMVYVWLGPDGRQNGQLGLRTIAKYNALFEQRGRREVGTRSAPRDDLAYARLRLDGTKDLLEKHLLRENYNTLGALAYLLDRPYWSRAWVLQEVALARHVTLWCGNAMHIAPREYGGFWSRHILAIVPRPFDGRCADLGSAFSILNCASGSSDEHTQHPTPAIHVLLVDHMRRACSDPRDKVYSLRAWFSKDCSISIDYSLTPEQVWRQTAKAIIGMEDPHDVLSACPQFEAMVLKTLRDAMGLKPVGKMRF